MKLPLKVTNEMDARTKQWRWIIRDAKLTKLGDFGSRRTAENQMRKIEAMSRFDDFAEYAWLGL